MFGRKKKVEDKDDQNKIEKSRSGSDGIVSAGFNSSIPRPSMPFGDNESRHSEIKQEQMEKIRKFLDPKNPSHKYHVNGTVSYNLREYDKAIEEFDKAIAYDPNDTLAHFKKGESLYQLGRYDEALKAYDEVIRINPNYDDAHFGKGNVLFDIERYDEALKAYDEVIRINPNGYGGHFNKALIFEKLDRKEESLQEYDKAIRLAPNNADVHNNKANVLKRSGDLHEAMEEVDLALGIDSDDVVFLLTKAEIYALEDRINEGLDLLREKIFSSAFLRTELKEIISNELNLPNLSDNEKQLLNKISSEL
ncbi:MAG: tetratricopeptide repeat protein [Nitrosotalea sp.]